MPEATSCDFHGEIVDFGYPRVYSYMYRDQLEFVLCSTMLSIHRTCVFIYEDHAQMTCGRLVSTTATTNQANLECAIHRDIIGYLRISVLNCLRKIVLQTVVSPRVLMFMNGIITIRLAKTAVSNLHNQSGQSA